jgi:hypothetical protein
MPTNSNGTIQRYLYSTLRSDRYRGFRYQEKSVGPEYLREERFEKIVLFRAITVDK